jgi:hypothetical protein
MGKVTCGLLERTGIAERNCSFAELSELKAMELQPVELRTIEELYSFVESSVEKTALVLDHDALYRAWPRLVSSSCSQVRWFYTVKPLPEVLIQHLSNFAHTALNAKSLVLLEYGRVLNVIDLVAVDGLSQPHRLAGIVENAFKPRNQKASMGRGFSGDPFVLLGVSETDSDDVVAKKYKQLVMEYHPDRVAHLGQELKDLAAKKTTEINAAFAAIRRSRKI